MYKLIVFILFLTPSILFSQNLVFVFKGTVTNMDNGKNEQGVTVSIVQNGTTVTSATSGANGKYTLKNNVNFTTPFSIVFAKAGMVSKKVDFNFSTLNEEDIPPGEDYQPLQDLSMAVFAERQNVDFSFLNNEPVASFAWNANKMVPILDKVASEKTRTKIEKLILQSEQQADMNEAKYQAAIKDGDALSKAGKYAEAKVKYADALKLKPGEAYPTSKMSELDGLIAAQQNQNTAAQQAETEYQSLIKAGDALRDQKKYDQAIQKYKEAATKKSDAYPQDQINAIKKIQDEQKATEASEAKFKETIAAADNLYNQKKYAEAKLKYEAAKQLKPTDAYVATRISDIDKKAAEQAGAEEKKKKVDDALANANSLFSSGKYDEAKAAYGQVQSLDPTQQSVVGPKIKECDAKIAAAAKDKEKQQKIEKLTAEGEAFMNANKLTEAKATYTQLQTLDPTNTTAKQKLDEIQKKTMDAAAAAEQKAKLVKLITDGDAADKAGKLVDAKLKYEDALANGADASVQTKLDAIKKKIADQEAKADTETRFQNLKNEGMQLASQQKYDEAKVKLNEANQLKPDPAITAKITEIEKAQKAAMAAAQLDQENQALLTQAQQKEQSGDLEGALTKYKELAVKKPADKSVKDKITELENQKKNSLAQKEVETKYADLMKKGDELMTQKNYLEAIKVYNQALAVKPNEKAPSEKAAEAQRLEQEKSQDADQQYEKILSTAQSKVDDKDYNKAKELAERAMKIKPADKRPQELLDQIAKLQKQERDYKSKMNEAESFISAKDYKKAIAAYEQAKAIKTDETQPQAKIDELTKLMGEQASAQEKENQYKEFYKKATVAQAEKRYADAKQFYESALQVKPSDALATSGLNEVKQLLDNAEKQQQEEQSKKSELEELNKQAETAFNSNNFTEAKVLYDNILKKDPKNTNAKLKLEEISKKEVAQNNAEKDTQLKAALKQADEAFTSKNYADAKLKYEEVLKLRPSDPVAKKKLAEIDAIENPVVTKSDKLQDLGDPYEENDISKGYELLLKADVERKNLQNEAAKSKVEDVYSKEEEMSEVTALQQQRTTQEMAFIQNKINVDSDLADLDRQASVEIIRAKEAELDTKGHEESHFEHVEVMKAQEALTMTAHENELANNDRRGAQEENATKLNNEEVLVETNTLEMVSDERSSNLAVDQKIDAAKDTYEAISMDNAEARTAAEQKVKGVVASSDRSSEVIGTAKTAQLYEARESLEQTNAQLESDRADEMQKQSENNEEIKETQKSIANENQLVADKKAISMNEVNESIDNINKSIVSDNADRGDARVEFSDQLSKKTTEIDQAAFESYKREQLKYIQNQGELSNYTTNTIEISEIADQKHVQNVELVETIDKNTFQANGSVAMSDDEQRAMANAKMDDFNDELQSNVLDGTNAGNAQSLEDVNKNRTVNENEKIISEQEKRFNAQDQMNKVNSSVPQKVRVANSLGQDYPEGVSQESFTQKDENGLPTAVITRRIVVINGQGNVYVRTQTLQAITFSKNGEPSTEYVWQKETTGPHLKKNY